MTTPTEVFQEPITSVPDGFTHSTAMGPWKFDTSGGSWTLPITRGRVGVASGYASQTADKRLPPGDLVKLPHTTACPFPVRNGVSHACRAARVPCGAAGTYCDQTRRLSASKLVPALLTSSVRTSSRTSGE